MEIQFDTTNPIASCALRLTSAFFMLFIAGQLRGNSLLAPPPSNDDPCAATALTVGTSCSYTQFTNAGATATAGVPAPTCSLYNGGDVWFSATVPASGNLNLNSNTGVMTDGGMAVYTGSCDNLTQIACDDDSSPNGFMPLLNLAGLTPGATVYIRFWDYGNLNNGTFRLCAFEPAPPPPPPPPLVTACSGTFTDAGGANSNYANNLNYVTTYCPEVAGTQISMNFSSFSIENGFDNLIVYNGPDINAPQLGFYTGTELQGITIQAANASGCLTFAFDSDGTVTSSGWEASVSCIAPCQTIQSVLVSTSPNAQTDGVIRICQGQSVTLNGTGTFSDDSAGASYNWTFNNGAPIAGQSATQIFSAAGTYLANLNILDAYGCENLNSLNVRIEVSTTPAISTSVNPAVLCLGQSAEITATATATPNVQSCTPPIVDPTFLPDGAGFSYESPLTVSCFNSNQTVQSATDIQSICINIEHSWLDDLDIVIQCPNGSTAFLFDNAFTIGSANLGIPVATGAVDQLNTTNTAPGVGSTYCFLPNAALPNLAQGISTTTINFPSSLGGTYADFYVPAGNYEPTGSLSSLVGCPLNGQWTIIVTDNIAQDNGYIFNWDLNFSSTIPTTLNFTPTLISQGWQAASGLSTTVGSQNATVTPTSLGNNCYQYSVTDNFGCTYTQPACVNVVSGNASASASPNATVCQNQPLSPNIAITTTGATGIGQATNLPVGLTASWSANTITITGTPTSTGTFNFSIPLLGGCGPAAATGTITINAAAVPLFTQIPPICSGSVLTLPTTSSNGISGNWSPAVNNTATTTYTFTPENGACATPTSMTVAVQPIPAAFASAPIIPPCEGESATLQAQTVAGATYSWTGPGGFTSTSQNPVITNVTLANEGQYTLMVTLNGCSQTANAFLNIEEALPYVLQYGGPFCSNEGLNAPQNTWVGEGSYASTPAGLSIDPSTGVVNPAASAPGTYIITFTPLGCGQPQQTTLVVFPVVVINSFNHD